MSKIPKENYKLLYGICTCIKWTQVDDGYRAYYKNSSFPCYTMLLFHDENIINTKYCEQEITMKYENDDIEDIKETLQLCDDDKISTNVLIKYFNDDIGYLDVSDGTFYKFENQDDAKMKLLDCYMKGIEK
jgi:hypothetical protein